MTGAGPDAAGCGGTAGHVLRRQAALDRAHGAARLDGLTGLLNRRAFDDDVLHVSEGVNLAVIDVDGVNDREGHAQGDKPLRVSAQALQAKAGTGAGAEMNFPW
ncbi:GGDEF domain-containing protein [Deinococcus radiotolerans]|uniref:GGDEF domain-containing protein n=1 Tax=Deinococcus radiotolerans TaxID=1309407 RepID=UPI00166352F8|nr:GGDEF domain-containing protein [Deinococcus radiotolerans]